MSDQDANLKSQFLQLKKYIPLAFPVVALGIVAILLVKILLPETLSVKERFEKLDEEKGKIFELEKKLQILNEFEKETLVDLINKSQILIPTSNDLALLLLYLKDLERQSGVVVESTNFQSTGGDLKVVQSSDKIEFRIALMGNLEQFFRFFRLLNDPTKRILTIKEISLTAPTKQTSQQGGIYKASVDISAPYSPFPQSVGGVEQEIPEVSDIHREIIERISMITKETSTSEFETPAVDFEPRENPFEF